MKPVSIQFPVDKNRYQAQTCYTDGKTQNNYTGVQLMPDQASENVIQKDYSYRSASTGFLLAARQLCQLTVNKCNSDQ
jgi:hypothetical protein